MSALDMIPGVLQQIRELERRIEVLEEARKNEKAAHHVDPWVGGP